MLALGFCLNLLGAIAVTLKLHEHDASFTPDAVLRVTASNISIAGIHRYSTLVNGTSPGPELRVRSGEPVWIRVYNDLTDRNTTMHWHGLSQAAYPFSDGTPLASQWPIPPGHFFDYELQLSNHSAGTYFYHSHVGFQASSAAGALVVEDAATAPYEPYEDRVMLISELWNRSDATVEQGLTGNPIKWSGEGLALLVNGQGISNYNPVDASTARLHVIDVEPSKAYRLRLIGGTALAYTAVAFQNHTNLKIIEADGAYTQSVNTSFFQIGSGQRLSALLQTKSCEELRRSGTTDFYIQLETRERPTTSISYAILRYETRKCKIQQARLPLESNPSKKPLDIPPTVSGWLDRELRPLATNHFPTSNEVTRRVFLNVQQINDGYSIWQDDGMSWTEDAHDRLPLVVPSKPYLVALYENETGYLPDYAASIANMGLDPKTKTFPARIGEVLDIVIQNIGADGRGNSTGGGLDVHPWHAHGGHFYDLGSGPGEWSEDVMESLLNGTEPVLRDTTMLYRYTAEVRPGEKQGWRAWRLRITQPGVWMMHCHTLQHMIMGMQTVWVMGDAKDILRVPKPLVQGYLEFGGSVYGNSTHHPRIVHFGDDAALRESKMLSWLERAA